MLFSSQHLCYNMQSQRKLYPSIATSITRYHLATCHTTKKFHREQICHRMWNTWSTPVESKLPNNCRVSRIVVIIYFQLCILTHFLDLLKGNIMLLTFFFCISVATVAFFCQHHFILNALRGPWQRERGVGELRKSCKHWPLRTTLRNPTWLSTNCLIFFSNFAFYTLLRVT